MFPRLIAFAVMLAVPSVGRPEVVQEIVPFRSTDSSFGGGIAPIPNAELRIRFSDTETISVDRFDSSLGTLNDVLIDFEFDVYTLNVEEISVEQGIVNAAMRLERSYEFTIGAASEFRGLGLTTSQVAPYVSGSPQSRSLSVPSDPFRFPEAGSFRDSELDKLTLSFFETALNPGAPEFDIELQNDARVFYSTNLANNFVRFSASGTEYEGTVTVSYDFTPVTVPEPNVAFLGLSSLCLVACGVIRKRKRSLSTRAFLEP